MCWRLRVAGVLLWFALPLSSPRAPAWAALVAGPEFQVNTFTTGSQRRPAVAADAAGNFVVVWVSQDQDGSGDGVFARRYDSTGIPVGPEFRVNTYTTGFQGDPAVAADAAGNFLVVWSSDQYGAFRRNVFGQRYDRNGEPQGPEFRVNTYTTFFHESPAVAVDAAGRFVVVWQSLGQDRDGDGVFGRRFHASGAPQGPEFQVNTYTTDDQLAPAVAADAGGNFVVVWTSYSITGPVFRSEVDGRRFDPSGRPRGPEFTVSGVVFGGSPDVAADSRGNFVVVWESYPAPIQGQRYDPSGLPLGGPFRVSSGIFNQEFSAAVAADSPGNFVVVWVRDGPYSGVDVYGQRYDSSGASQGGEFRINTYTTSYQSHPAVAVDAAGNFVVAWESFGQDGSGYGVFARRFCRRRPSVSR